MYLIVCKDFNITPAGCYKRLKYYKQITISILLYLLQKIVMYLFLKLFIKQKFLKLNI